MKIIIEREARVQNLGYIGKLYLYDDMNNLIYRCDTCENPDVGPASNCDLAIPEGIYKLETHVSGKFSWTFKNEKLNRIPLLWNEQVPKTRVILIHAGNSHKDTAGCVLIGQMKGGNFINSRATVNELFGMIYEENQGEFRNMLVEICAKSYEVGV